MHPEFKWLLILLGLLWFGWFITGGPTRIQTNRQNPFIEPYTYDREGQIYGIDELKNRTRP